MEEKVYYIQIIVDNCVMCILEHRQKESDVKEKMNRNLVRIAEKGGEHNIK